MIWGYDVSHYQSSFDHGRARREGFDFAMLKATEGSSYVDPDFGRHLANARAAGMLVAAYHYVRADSSAASQADLISRVVPRDVPVVLDVEANGGGIGLTRDLNGRLNQMGFKTPLLYLPKWYWQQIGSPDMRGLPPLWYSRYADNNGGFASQIWERSASWFDQYWGGYGGLPVEVLQFSSSASVAGTTPVDVNAYRGTREQLAALFGGAAPALAAPGGIESMAFNDSFKDWAGNDQTVVSWMNHVDERLARLDHQFNGGDQPSRIPGDANTTDWGNGIMDTTAKVAIAKAEIEDLHRKADELKAAVAAVSTPQVDLDALAAKVAAQLGDSIAARVADVFAQRMVN